MKHIILLIFTAFLSLNIFGQMEGNPENWCRNGLFPRDGKSYSIAKIKGKNVEKIYFYSDDDDCPDGKNCRQKSYLIPKDEVIVSREYKNFACVWFQPKKGSETVGWIPVEKLEYLNLLQSRDSIIGEWYFYDNSIEIAKTDKPQTYKVTGNAFWKGYGDNIHIGELDSEGIFDGQTLKLGEDDDSEYACKVSITSVGNYLIVADNMNCGGANVTFSGVYRRNKTKK